MSLELLVTLGVVGTVLLFIAVVLDGLFDFFGSEPVLPSAAFFLAIFGFSGALTASLPADVGTTTYVAVGAGVGLLTTAVFWFSYRALKRYADQDETHVPNMTKLVGTPATVNWWAGEKGEVIVSWFGTTRKINAKSDEQFANAQKVFVTEVIDANLLEVSATPPTH